jgi:uncharacterized protein YciI
VSGVAPIRREVVVDLDPQQAFEVFTARIGDWWPVGELSVLGAGASVAFVDGELVETLGDRSARWGTVTQWRAGELVAFSWHPGSAPERASHVSVSFTAQQGRTLVVLEHSGWEVFDDPAGARTEYDNGWPKVLDLYRETATDPETFTWVALVHRPGPAAPADASLFTDPRFGDHMQFLDRMQAAGYLVAAGPMLDAHGEGMTVLRLAGADRLKDAEQLATVDDLSVKSGFFEVTIRPWRVVKTRG